jgi:hypothetical protein
LLGDGDRTARLLFVERGLILLRSLIRLRLVAGRMPPEHLQMFRRDFKRGPLVAVAVGVLGAVGRVLAMKVPFGVLMFTLGGVSGGAVVAKLRPLPPAVVAPSVRTHVPVAVARPTTPPLEAPVVPPVAVVEPPAAPQGQQQQQQMSSNAHAPIEAPAWGVHKT